MHVLLGAPAPNDRKECIRIHRPHLIGAEPSEIAQAPNDLGGIWELVATEQTALLAISRSPTRLGVILGVIPPALTRPNPSQLAGLHSRLDLRDPYLSGSAGRGAHFF